MKPFEGPRRPALTTCLLVSMVACGGTPDDVEGVATVRSMLCDGLEHARVTRLGAEEPIELEGARFSFVASGGVAHFRATAEGHVPTLTRVNASLGEGAVDVALFPRTLVDAVSAVAGFDFDESSGVAVIFVENTAGMPVQGVQVDLASGGSAASREALREKRRHLRFQDGAPTVEPVLATTATTEAVVFFALPPGGYVVQGAADDGRSFPSIELHVREGSVSVGRLVREGDVGARPPTVEGQITIISSFPDLSVLNGPLAYATVTVDDPATGESWTGETDARGHYGIAVPFRRRTVGVRFDAPGYESARSEDFCFGDRGGRSFSAIASFDEHQQTLEVRGHATPQPGTGRVEIVVVDEGFTPLEGVLLETDVPGGEPYYGQDHAGVLACGRALCGEGEPCPDGTRCQDGECVLGEAPLCTRGTSCPAGHLARAFTSPTGSGRSYCVPSLDSCDDGTRCPAGTFCQTETFTPDGEVELGDSICKPYGELRAATGPGGWGRFVDVPPGRYEVSVDAPGRTFERVRFRVDPGVTTRFGLYASAAP